LSSNYLSYLEKQNEFDKKRTKWTNLSEKYMNSVIKDVTDNTPLLEIVATELIVPLFATLKSKKPVSEPVVILLDT
jgi:hypothetical protein